MHRMHRLGLLVAARRTPYQRSAVVSQRLAAAFSSNITYSGGQASEGQGGFYASGGARANPEQDPLVGGGTTSRANSKNPRQSMLALAADVQKITTVMKELETLEGFLETGDDTKTSKRSIELKSSIKKLMTQPDVLESLNRLEAQGAPVWGLSTNERELIVTAREKVNEC